MTKMFTAVVVSMAMAMAGCFSPADELTKPQELEVGALNPDGTCNGLAVVDPGMSVQPGSTCICTRRDAVPNGSCAKGVGESVTATIGPGGGTLELQGRQGLSSGVSFKLTVPPTALSVPTVIKVTETAIPPPAGMVDWSPIYLVEPIDVVFASPVSLQLPFNNGRGSATFDAQLSVFWSGSQSCSLERVPSTYANAGFAQASITRGGYAIAGYAQQGSAPSCN